MPRPAALRVAGFLRVGVAAVEERFELGGLVEYPVGPQRQAALADLGGRVVGQHQHMPARRALLASLQHRQARPLLEKEVDHGQVPALVVGAQGRSGLRRCLGRRHNFQIGQLVHGRQQVFANGRVVFDKYGDKRHRERTRATVAGLGLKFCAP